MKLFQKLLVAGTALGVLTPMAAQASEAFNLEAMNSYERSGSKAKIFQGIIQENWKDKIQTSKLFESLNNRKEISFDDYQNLHKSKNIPPLSNHSVRFSHTDKTVNSKGYRRYKI